MTGTGLLVMRTLLLFPSYYQHVCFSVRYQTLCSTFRHPRARAEFCRSDIISNVTDLNIFTLCKVIHVCQKIMTIYTTTPSIQVMKPVRNLRKESDVLNIFHRGIRTGHCAGWPMVCMHAVSGRPRRSVWLWKPIWRIWRWVWLGRPIWH